MDQWETDDWESFASPHQQPLMANHPLYFVKSHCMSLHEFNGKTLLGRSSASNGNRTALGQLGEDSTG